MKGFRDRLSYANVTVTLLVFIVLGGTALAALGKNSVGSREIKKNAVKAAEIAEGAVRASEVRDGAIGSAEIADGSLGAADLAPGTAGVQSETNPGIGFAVVAADGTLVAGSRDVSDTVIAAPADNTYRVTFTRDVSACAYTATPDGAASSDTPAVETSDNPNNVRIDMDSASGFHLHVICPVP